MISARRISPTMADKTGMTSVGQWWNFPPEQRFAAYYKNLRVNYGMYATEAFAMAKKAFREYPIFMADPMGTLRSAVRAELTYEVWDAKRREAYPTADHSHWDSYIGHDHEHVAAWNPHTGRHFIRQNLRAD